MARYSTKQLSTVITTLYVTLPLLNVSAQITASRLRLEKNMQSISIERNVSDMITRLWAFGSDDLTVSSVNGGKAYIDSPNIEKYGVQEGYKDYSDYTSADKLYRNAKWEFDEDNEDRIDVPQLTISGKLIDLSKLPNTVRRKSWK